MNFQSFRRGAASLLSLFLLSPALAAGGNWHKYFSGAQVPAHYVRLKMTATEQFQRVLRGGLEVSYKLCKEDTKAELPAHLIPDLLRAAVVEIYYGMEGSVTVENIEAIRISYGEGASGDCMPRAVARRKITLLQYSWACRILQLAQRSEVSGPCKQKPSADMGAGLARAAAVGRQSEEQKRLIEAWERKHSLRMPPNVWVTSVVAPTGERRIIGGRECRGFGAPPLVKEIPHRYCIVAAPPSHSGAQSGLLLGTSPFQIWPGVLMEASIPGFELRLIDAHFDIQVSADVFKVPDPAQLPPLQKDIL